MFAVGAVHCAAVGTKVPVVTPPDVSVAPVMLFLNVHDNPQFVETYSCSLSADEEVRCAYAVLKVICGDVPEMAVMSIDGPISSSTYVSEVLRLVIITDLLPVVAAALVVTHVLPPGD